MFNLIYWSRVSSALYFFFLFGACSQDQGSDPQVGEPALTSCEAYEVLEVSDRELIPEGFAFSSKTALDRTTGSFQGVLTRQDETSSQMTLTLEASDEITLERRSLQGGRGRVEPAMAWHGDCLDAFVFEATIGVFSEDVLNETFTTKVMVDSREQGSFFVFTEAEELKSSIEPFGFDPSEMETVGFLLIGKTEKAGWNAELSFHGVSFPSGVGPDSVVSATLDDWGKFETTPN
jgi:hypothetical protein